MKKQLSVIVLALTMIFGTVTIASAQGSHRGGGHHWHGHHGGHYGHYRGGGWYGPSWGGAFWPGVGVGLLGGYVISNSMFGPVIVEEAPPVVVVPAPQSYRLK